MPSLVLTLGRQREPDLPKTTHKRLILLHRQPIPPNNRLSRIQHRRLV